VGGCVFVGMPPHLLKSQNKPKTMGDGGMGDGERGVFFFLSFVI
jgi:hypothetical protein